MAGRAHPEKPIRLFYSYSHRDEAFRGELEAHLSFLRRSQQIAEWHDRMIGAGDEWKGQIDRQLAAADIILLLVSADFIASDYCWGEEMAKALARHHRGEARVIPVILRRCRWQRTPLGRLQAVPKDGKPVSEWPNHDAAFDEIATALERTIVDLHEQRRRAAEQRQQEAEEARKRAETEAHQAAEEQQREAQWRREQDEARRAAEAEAARAKPTKGPRTSPSVLIFHQKRWMALIGAVAVAAVTGVVVWQELGKENPSTPLPSPATQESSGTSVVQPAIKPDQPEVTAKSAATPTKDRPGQTFRDCDECPDMVVVPAGTFTMGSPMGEEGRDDDEGPPHPVTIRQPFAVGKYEITRGEYARFVEATRRGEKDGCFSWTGKEWKEDASKSWREPGFPQTDEHPVLCVSWDDAEAYVQWLSEKTKKKYRLLTEAEWEYAARAGTTTARFWGDSADQGCPYANGADLTAKDQFPGWTVANCRDGSVYTATVGRLQPNGFGLYDILGNVWEWVEDCWHNGYAGAPSDGNAWTRGGQCSQRVIRGGSWNVDPRNLRSAYRSWDHPDIRNTNGGFRVARTLD